MLLKETLYSKQQFEVFSNVLEKKIVDFDKQKFFNAVFDKQWSGRELKQRMRHLTSVLYSVLPSNYFKATDKIIEIVDFIIQKKLMEGSFIPMSFAEYVEIYGLENYQKSIVTFEEITKLISCEFAVRPFILKYEEKMMQQMLKWSQHEHQNVRRLSSEGCRSRLPWSMALPKFKNNPSLIILILENLKNDSSVFVQKSVANNLNDISKDNPKLVIEIAEKWIGKTKNTDWIVKHACRTLLKAGNMQAMQLFGYSSAEMTEITNFEIKNKIIKIGENLEFSFNLFNKSEKQEIIRIEYALYFLRANGSLSKKVFKINEKKHLPQSDILINKKHSFKIRTTRKYYEGKQKISLIINGKEIEKPTEFQLKFNIN